MAAPAPQTDSTHPVPTKNLGQDFWRLWISASVSTLGDGIYVTALLLIAVTITTDPVELSLISVSGYLPLLAFALFSGVLADRGDRRRVMWITDAVRFVVVAVLTALVATGNATVWLLALAAFILGTGEILHGVAAQSIIPQLVSRSPEKLERANSRLMSAQIVLSDFAGRPIGGALYNVVSWLPLAVNAISFGLSSLLVRTLRPLPERPAARKNMVAEVREGLTWLARHRLLRTIAIAVTVGNFAFAMWNTVLALLLVERLRLDGLWFGVLTACLGIGGLLGSFGVARLSRSIGPAASMIGAMVVEGAATAVLGLVPARPVVGLMLALIGAAAVGWNVVTLSLRQSLVPDDIQGRVNGAYQLLGSAGAPVGAAIGGLTASWFGIGAPFLIGGGSVVLVSLVAAATVINKRAIEDAMSKA